MIYLLFLLKLTDIVAENHTIYDIQQEVYIMRDTPELEANKSESEKKFSQPDEALPLHESKEFNVTTASATCVEVLEENIKNHFFIP